MARHRLAGWRCWSRVGAGSGTSAAEAFLAAPVGDSLLDGRRVLGQGDCPKDPDLLSDRSYAHRPSLSHLWVPQPNPTCPPLGPAHAPWMASCSPASLRSAF